MILSRRLLLAGASIILGSPVAHATVLFSNFGPGDSYSHTTGLAINPSHSAAVKFTPAVTLPIDRVELAMVHTGGATGAAGFTLRIYPDNGGQPGFPSIVFQLGPAVEISADGVFATVDVPSHPVLSTGQSYWLMALSLSGLPTGDTWYLNTIGDNSTTMIGLDPTQLHVNGSVAPAFRIWGVPEPATPATLLGGGLALLLRRSRK